NPLTAFSVRVVFLGQLQSINNPQRVHLAKLLNKVAFPRHVTRLVLRHTGDDAAETLNLDRVPPFGVLQNPQHRAASFLLTDWVGVEQPTSREIDVEPIPDCRAPRSVGMASVPPYSGLTDCEIE